MGRMRQESSSKKAPEAVLAPDDSPPAVSSITDNRDEQDEKRQSRLFIPKGGPAQDAADQAPRRPPLPLETLAKLGAALVIVCYGTGLLVVNAYLLSFGASDFNLFRARFIFTGLLVLSVVSISVAFPVSAAALFVSFWRGPKGLGKGKSQHKKIEVALNWDSLLVGIMMLAVPYVIFVFALRQTVWNGLQGYWVSATTGGIIAFAWFAFIRRARHAERPKGTRKQTSPPAWTVYTAISIFLLPYTAWMFIYFAQQVFPHVPSQLGGAEPQTVQLLVKSGSATELRQLGIPVSSAAPDVIDNIDLLFTGENFYVIRTSSVTLVLTSDEVIGIRPITAP